MKNIASNFIIALLVLVGCSTSYISKRPTPTTPEEIGRQVVTSLAVGDTNTITALFITSDEFKTTSSGEDLDEKHAQLLSSFRAALPELCSQLKGAQFIRMNMKFVPEECRKAGLATHAGMDFGGIAFKEKTFALDNVWAVVAINGKERDIKLDAMVKVGSAWRLINPVQLPSVQKR